MLYKDRADAGRLLGVRLARRGFARDKSTVVLGLPRGGVPVAFEAAFYLGAPLDVFVVRKLGVPGHEELAMGAIASGGAIVLNPNVVAALCVSRDVIEEVARRERIELGRRERRYRSSRPPEPVEGRTAILVDDGLATGASMRAAIAALRERKPTKIVAAVPVAAESTAQEVARDVDELVCLATPEPFHAVGVWYEDFGQVDDDEVELLLEAASRRTPRGLVA